MIPQADTVIVIRAPNFKQGDSRGDGPDFSGQEWLLSEPMRVWYKVVDGIGISVLWRAAAA
jgi:hypothetical protein